MRDAAGRARGRAAGVRRRRTLARAGRRTSGPRAGRAGWGVHIGRWRTLEPLHGQQHVGDALDRGARRRRRAALRRQGAEEQARLVAAVRLLIALHGRGVLQACVPRKGGGFHLRGRRRASARRRAAAGAASAGRRCAHLWLVRALAERVGGVERGCTGAGLQRSGVLVISADCNAGSAPAG